MNMGGLQTGVEFLCRASPEFAETGKRERCAARRGWLSPKRATSLSATHATRDQLSPTRFALLKFRPGEVCRIGLKKPQQHGTAAGFPSGIIR